MLTPEPELRWRAARPFAWLGIAAVITGGLVAAAVAHAPVQKLVWMSAYLVLIVGVAQIVFGAGQAALSSPVASPGWIAGEWIVFNLGNAGVIAGTLAGRLQRCSGAQCCSRPASHCFCWERAALRAADGCSAIAPCSGWSS